MGIVGGLIVGSAAVEANLVSPIVVMVVAITALGSLAIPNEEFASAFRMLKYFFLFLGGYLGIFGIVIGVYLTVSCLLYTSCGHCFWSVDAILSALRRSRGNLWNIPL